MIDKKIVIVFTLIAILIVGGIIGHKIYKINNSEYNVVQTENKSNTTNNVLKNEIEEEKNEENVIVEETKEENTTTESNTQNTEVRGKEESDTQNEKENEASKKEQALNLVKKEWGEDNTVYYTVDSNSGNIYNISVRSKATTETLVEYEVDVNKKTVEMK